MSLYRRNNKGMGRLIAASALVLVVFAMDLISGGALRDTVRGFGAATHTLTQSAAASVFGGEFFRSRRALLEENKALQEELAELKTRLAGYAVLSQQIQSLRSLARFAEEEASVSAAVVSSFGSSPYSTFVIGVGSDDGVTIGDIVMTAAEDSAYVLGKVSDIGKSTSLVSFALSPNVTIEATVASASLNFEGEGSGRASAVAPEALEVALGDVVFAPEYGARPIGVVAAIVPDQANAVQQLYVSVPVNIASLTYVYVISAR